MDGERWGVRGVMERGGGWGHLFSHSRYIDTWAWASRNACRRGREESNPMLVVQWGGLEEEVERRVTRCWPATIKRCAYQKVCKSKGVQIKRCANQKVCKSKGV